MIKKHIEVLEATKDTNRVLEEEVKTLKDDILAKLDSPKIKVVPTSKNCIIFLIVVNYLKISKIGCIYSAIFVKWHLFFKRLILKLY